MEANGNLEVTGPEETKKDAHSDGGGYGDGRHVRLSNWTCGNKLFLFLFKHFDCYLYINNSKNDFLRYFELFAIHPSPVTLYMLNTQNKRNYHFNPIHSKNSIKNDRNNCGSGNVTNNRICPFAAHVTFNGDRDSDDTDAQGIRTSNSVMNPDVYLPHCLCTSIEKFEGEGFICVDDRDEEKNADEITKFRFKYAFNVDKNGRCEIFPAEGIGGSKSEAGKTNEDESEIVGEGNVDRNIDDNDGDVSSEIKSTQNLSKGDDDSSNSCRVTSCNNGDEDKAGVWIRAEVNGGECATSNFLRWIEDEVSVLNKYNEMNAKKNTNTNNVNSNSNSDNINNTHLIDYDYGYSSGSDTNYRNDISKIVHAVTHEEDDDKENEYKSIHSSNLVQSFHLKDALALQELAFFLWGPPDACMAFDVAFFAEENWRQKFVFCKRCEAVDLDVRDNNNNSGGNNKNHNNTPVMYTYAQANKCTCCRFRSSTLTMPKYFFEEICDDNFRMPVPTNNNNSSNFKSTKDNNNDYNNDKDACYIGNISNDNGNNECHNKDKPTETNTLLQLPNLPEQCIEMSDGDSWLSELPSDSSSSDEEVGGDLFINKSDNKNNTNRQNNNKTTSATHCVGDTSLKDENKNIDGDEEDGSNKNNNKRKLGKKSKGRKRDNKMKMDILSDVYNYTSICIKETSEKVVPLFLSYVLDDSSWMVMGAKNRYINNMDMCANVQTGNINSFMSMGCTDTWEVLLLLHSSSIPHEILSLPFRGCVDVIQKYICDSPNEINHSNNNSTITDAIDNDKKDECCDVGSDKYSDYWSVRKLFSRYTYTEKHKKKDSMYIRHSLTENKFIYLLKYSFSLSFIETKNVHPNLEFRAFVSGNIILGITHLFLGECNQQLATNGTLRKEIKKNIFEFAKQNLFKLKLPPVYAFDVYVHPKCDGTLKCWLLRLNPWGSQTDPLLFTYSELKEKQLQRLCSSGCCAACNVNKYAFNNNSNNNNISDTNGSATTNSNKKNNSLQTIADTYNSVQAKGYETNKKNGKKKKLLKCSCAESIDFRFVSSPDDEVNDFSRIVAMPQEFLDISKGGGTTDMSSLMEDLAKAHKYIFETTKKKNENKRESGNGNRSGNENA